MLAQRHKVMQTGNILGRNFLNDTNWASALKSSDHQKSLLLCNVNKKKLCDWQNYS